MYEEFIRKNVDELELFEKEPKGELTIVISEKKMTKNISQKLSESDTVSYTHLTLPTIVDV